MEVRKHGESYFIRDLITDRIYLRNRKWIKHSEKFINMEHRLKNMEVIFDQSVKHVMIDWSVKEKWAEPVVSCMKSQDSPITGNRVKFDNTCYLARVQLERWRTKSTASDSTD